jgi:hypothetical protein
VRRIKNGKKICLVLAIIGLTAACGSLPKEEGRLATYPTFKVFDRGYNEVFEATLQALNDYRLIRVDKANGYIKTAVTENSSSERFEFEVRVKERSKNKTSVTINNYIQIFQEGTGWKNTASNTVLEHSILLEIEKTLNKKRR